MELFSELRRRTVPTSMQSAAAPSVGVTGGITSADATASKDSEKRSSTAGLLRNSASCSDSHSSKGGGLSFGQTRDGKSLVHIEIPKGVWALMSLTFACSVTLLYVNVDMRSINIDEFKQIKNITVHQAAITAASRLRPEDSLIPSVLWVHAKGIDSGYLRHVIDGFRRAGYRVETRKPAGRWDVLWSHEYPFGDLGYELANLSPGQRVNHIPGTGYITNKVSLVTSPLRRADANGTYTRHNIPQAFKLPQQKDDFLEYARANPTTMWMQKSNNHRGIVVHNRPENVDTRRDDTFVQVLVSNPLLIDGYKFDIGVYVVMTSVSPLRVYIFESDVLLRFCSKQYVKPEEELGDSDSYIVGDHYRPIWKVPSLKDLYVRQKLSMKESINLHLRQRGLNSNIIWKQTEELIAGVYIEKQVAIEKASRRFSTRSSDFFELVRFDFLVDDELTVHLLEANMSPNLSSSHFRENARLYEQVVFNLMSVTGLLLPSSLTRSNGGLAKDIVVSDHDLSVFPNQCLKECENCPVDNLDFCALCAPCRSDAMREHLSSTFVEHQLRGKFRRVLPRPEGDALKGDAEKQFVKDPFNRLLSFWFKGKCQLDEAFCR